MTPLITQATGYFPELAADYKWFDLSEVDHTQEHTHFENIVLLRQPLPFEKCAATGIDLNGHPYCVLASREPDGRVLLNAATQFPNMLQIDPAFRIRPEDGAFDGIPIFFDDKRYEKLPEAIKCAQITLQVLSLLIRELNNRAMTSYVPTSKSNNAKRIRQGKKPLFDWHTVVIDAPKQKLPDQGGTHASPRLHDVRGHWVNRNGKRYWRKAHQRGDASLGVVFHDYKLKGENHGRQ